MLPGDVASALQFLCVPTPRFLFFEYVDVHQDFSRTASGHYKRTQLPSLRSMPYAGHEQAALCGQSGWSGGCIPYRRIDISWQTSNRIRCVKFGKRCIHLQSLDSERHLASEIVVLEITIVKPAIPNSRTRFRTFSSNGKNWVILRTCEICSVT